MPAPVILISAPTSISPCDLSSDKYVPYVPLFGDRFANNASCGFVNVIGYREASTCNIRSAPPTIGFLPGGVYETGSLTPGEPSPLSSLAAIDCIRRNALR